MTVAIITEKRICMTYWRNASRLPIGMAPLLIRWPPNHRIATVERFRIANSAGIIRANSRLTLSDVSVRSALATSKRRSSCSVRTNARMTRMPERASRMTWLMRSILTCMDRKSGIARMISDPITSAMSGMITTRSADRGTSSRSAMMMPPTLMIGARIITLSAITMTIWTCCTSFVLRVISDGVPNCPVSTGENSSTLRKTALRTSRPKAIAVREAK